MTVSITALSMPGLALPLAAVSCAAASAHARARHTPAASLCARRRCSPHRAGAAASLRAHLLPPLLHVLQLSHPVCLLPLNALLLGGLKCRLHILDWRGQGRSAMVLGGAVMIRAWRAAHPHAALRADNNRAPSLPPAPSPVTTPLARCSSVFGVASRYSRSIFTSTGTRPSEDHGTCSKEHARAFMCERAAAAATVVRCWCRLPPLARSAHAP